MKQSTKKLWAILLISMLAFSFAACGGNDEPIDDSADDKDNPSQQKDDEGSEASDSKAKAFVSSLGTQYYMEMRFSIGTDEAGEPEYATAYTALKDNMVYSSFNNMEIFLYRDNMEYSLNPAGQTYAEAPFSNEEMLSLLKFSSDSIVYDIATGSDKINGRDLDYEDVTIDGAAERFYFEGDKLAFMESEGQLTEVTDYGFTVDSSIFEIPAGYAKTE